MAFRPNRKPVVIIRRSKRLDFLTEGVKWELGSNALGALMVGIIILPICIAPESGMNSTKAGFMLFAGLAVAVIDLAWRFKRYEQPAWMRLIFITGGGALLCIPGWVMGLATVGMFFFIRK